MNAPELDFLTYEELAAELAKRYPFLVLVTLRDSMVPDKEEFRLHFGGSPTVAIGLLERAKDRILRIINALPEKTDE